MSINSGFNSHGICAPQSTPAESGSTFLGNKTAHIKLLLMASLGLLFPNVNGCKPNESSKSSSEIKAQQEMKAGEKMFACIGDKECIEDFEVSQHEVTLGRYIFQGVEDTHVFPADWRSLLRGMGHKESWMQAENPVIEVPFQGFKRKMQPSEYQNGFFVIFLDEERKEKLVFRCDLGIPGGYAQLPETKPEDYPYYMTLVYPDFDYLKQRGLDVKMPVGGGNEVELYHFKPKHRMHLPKL